MNGIDPKRFGKVAVLLGGVSSERDVSINSGRLILQSLRESGINAYPFDPAKQPLSVLKNKGFTRVFNALHGGYGENGQIQGALDFYGIRYTGSNVLGSALSIDKLRTKLIWQQIGIPTPPFETVYRGDDYIARTHDIVAKLGLPLFVKPSSEGSSIAVQKVKTLESLPSALEETSMYGQVMIIESSIEIGEEYTACIVTGLNLPLIRIVPFNEFYNYHAKYISNNTKYIIPCKLSKNREIELKFLAKQAFDVLGCTNWGRVDFIINDDGKPYFLEVNTTPGMTYDSLLPKAAQAIGIKYSELIIKILSLTLDV
ncbi:MAG: D-alanine--D-alanine ligase [Burkholderia sp.]|nr:D-alanine--D-alanine ligase [Burkholderia sp.]